MDRWLTEARDALAAAAGLQSAELAVDADTQVRLLQLARVAAHESGARTNAPLLSYLLGVAHARSGRPVDELARAVRDAAG